MCGSTPPGGRPTYWSRGRPTQGATRCSTRCALSCGTARTPRPWSTWPWRAYRARCCPNWARTPSCWSSAHGAAAASPACCSAPTAWPPRATPRARWSSCPGPAATGAPPAPSGQWGSTGAGPTGPGPAWSSASTPTAPTTPPSTSPSPRPPCAGPASGRSPPTRGRCRPGPPPASRCRRRSTRTPSGTRPGPSPRASSPRTASATRTCAPRWRPCPETRPATSSPRPRRPTWSSSAATGGACSPPPP